MDANERRARATQEATQWWNRLCIERPAEISRDDRELFTQWLRESPLHVAELLRIAHMHGALERFKGWSEIEVGGADGLHNVVSLRERLEEATESSSGNGRSAEAERAAPRSRAGTWAIAAGACLIAILAGWFALGARGQLIETELAERRQVMLDDGSVVQLEPETKLRVRFEDRDRLVALEHGRALFRVAKDAQRPFWVTTDHTSVRAVGTAFGVESSKRGVVVTVAEGSVAVGRGAVMPISSVSPENGRPAFSAGQDALASEILVTAGQQITVQSSGAMDRVRAVDAARALAWAQGQLIFDNAALADVVAEFNRYNRTQLRIDDHEVAARAVSGVFEATDIETLLAFIRQGSSEIRITHTDRGVVIGSSSRSDASDESTVQ
jgi:transmembrane sensor